MVRVGTKQEISSLNCVYFELHPNFPNPQAIWACFANSTSQQALLVSIAACHYLGIYAYCRKVLRAVTGVWRRR
jgi:hypothetical protein